MYAHQKRPFLCQISKETETLLWNILQPIVLSGLPRQLLAPWLLPRWVGGLVALYAE